MRQLPLQVDAQPTRAARLQPPKYEVLCNHSKCRRGRHLCSRQNIFALNKRVLVPEKYLDIFESPRCRAHKQRSRTGCRAVPAQPDIFACVYLPSKELLAEMNSGTMSWISSTGENPKPGLPALSCGRLKEAYARWSPLVSSPADGGIYELQARNGLEPTLLQTVRWE